MGQLMLIKSSHKIEWSPRSRLQGGVHCQEAKTDAIIADNSEVATNIALLSLWGEIPEQILPEIILISAGFTFIYFYDNFISFLKLTQKNTILLTG